MANPTAQVQSVFSTFEELDKYWPLNPANTADTFQAGEMLGVRLDTGYASHFDDSAPMYFLGIHAAQRKIIQSDTPAADYYIRYRRPRFLGLPVISTGSFPNAIPSLPTAMELPVYAANSGQVQVGTPAGLVYGNYVGTVAGILSVSPMDLSPSQSVPMVWVAPSTFDERQTYHGYLTMAATGSQSLDQRHLNKMIIVPNTAALTLTLPQLNTATPGDRIQFAAITSVNAVTLAAFAGDKINNATTFAMSGAINAMAEIVATDLASGWLVLNKI